MTWSQVRRTSKGSCLPKARKVHFSFLDPRGRFVQRYCFFTSLESRSDLWWPWPVSLWLGPRFEGHQKAPPKSQKSQLLIFRFSARGPFVQKYCFSFTSFESRPDLWWPWPWTVSLVTWSQVRRTSKDSSPKPDKVHFSFLDFPLKGFDFWKKSKKSHLWRAVFPPKLKKYWFSEKLW